MQEGSLLSPKDCNFSSNQFVIIHTPFDIFQIDCFELCLQLTIAHSSHACTIFDEWLQNGSAHFDKNDDVRSYAL